MSLTFPDGPIRTAAPWGSFGVEWSAISQWSALIEAAASEFDVPAERIASHIVIESQGNARAVQQNNQNGWSYGLMQVVPRWWLPLIEQLSGKRYVSESHAGQALLDNPALAIRAGTAVLRTFFLTHNDWDRASSEFFLGNPDWRGADTVNDTTGPAYRAALNGLLEELSTTPAPSPNHPYDVIFGGRPYRVEYGWLADAGLDYYGYGVDHGTSRPTQHTGDDVLVPYGTPLYAPAPGVVDCVGGRGTPRWGQSCGAYNDYGDAGGGRKLGVGNITIYLDSEHKLTLGHCRTATVEPGQRVTAGQQVGTSGGMNGAHTHAEVSVNRGGTYWLVDPVPALRAAMGGGATTPGPLAVRTALIPEGNPNRPGLAINAGGPRYITVHETGNTNAGANAERHRKFTHEEKGGSERVSFHYVVDDREAIQLLPHGEIGWHAGDGCDSRTADLGCFDSIAIETCVNRDGDWERTLRNLVALIVKLIRENPTLSADRIRQHHAWSGKNCPERIRREGRWEWLVGEVKRELAGEAPATTTTAAPEPAFAGLPDWLPAEYFVAAFPLADPNGVVTKKVIAILERSYEAVPWFVGKVDVAPGKNLWRFSEFTLMNDGSKVWEEGETP